MTKFKTPQSIVRAGFARADVTPPVGIYHRMWGAAVHDTATGVHLPLTATALWLDRITGGDPLLILGLDHCVFNSDEFTLLRERISQALRIDPARVQIALSHTHGSGWMGRNRAHLPGGDMIGPYLDHQAEVCAELAVAAAACAEPATIVYGTGQCTLARHRDFFDSEHKLYACGFNPTGEADDTLLVAQVTADSGATLGTIVNYACHPTTLAYQNTLISPDYIGAMRSVVEGATSAPCLFLQGASGDLGPQNSYTGETAVADRNGRELGYSVLAALEALPSPGTVFEYAGPVVSGATLGTWEHRPLNESQRLRLSAWQAQATTVPLPYRSDLPRLESTQKSLADWQHQEASARTAGDEARTRECRAHVEQMTRQMTRLESLPPGKAFPYTIQLLRMGDAVWLFLPGELYQMFQVKLRLRFPHLRIIISTISNDWQPGYIPTAEVYGKGIYQEIIAAVAPESLETLLNATTQLILSGIAPV